MCPSEIWQLFNLIYQYDINNLDDTKISFPKKENLRFLKKKKKRANKKNKRPRAFKKITLLFWSTLLVFKVWNCFYFGPLRLRFSFCPFMFDPIFCLALYTSKVYFIPFILALHGNENLCMCVRIRSSTTYQLVYKVFVLVLTL